MCLIVRDQREYILEWVEHYLKLGVGRIYLYDDGSDPAIIPAIGHLVEEGVVQYAWMSRKMHNVGRREACEYFTLLLKCKLLISEAYILDVATRCDAAL